MIVDAEYDSNYEVFMKAKSDMNRGAQDIFIIFATNVMHNFTQKSFEDW